MSVTIRVEGADRLQRKLRDPQVVAGPFGELLRTASREAQEVARRGAPGSVARSMQAEVHGLQAEVYSTHPAALPIEVGRRAGAPMPPPAALEAWARRHGITAAPFVLARAIARRGIKGRFFLRAARQHLERRLPAYLRELGRDIERRWDR